jgi:uncharacterized protein YybS (DUF2232 family)
MGTRFKNKKPAHSVISVGTITLILQSLMILLLFYTIGLDPINGLKQLFLDGMSSMPEELKSLVLVQQQEMIVDLIINSIPFYIILFSFIFVFISYVISHTILNKMGENLPKLPSYLNWKLPKFLVYVYVIALLIEMVVSLNQNSMLSMIVVNLLLLLTITFSLQAILFIFYLSHQKNWNRMIPIVLSCLIVIPFTSLIYILMGIIDTLYPLREKIERN